MLNEITLETSRGENPALWNESESSQLLMLFSHSVMSDSSRPCGLQHTRLLCSSPSPGACSNSCPLSQWCHTTISFSVAPFFSCLQSFSASGLFSNEWAFQHQSFQWMFRVYVLEYWLVWSPCSPRDFQESSPASQFKRLNSLVLSLLYGPALTSIHDYWKNHGFDYTNLCQII